MKVYCNDCKRLKHDYGVPGVEIHIEYCDLPIKSDNYKQQYKEKRANPHTQNINNDCSYFIKKIYLPLIIARYPGIVLFILYALVLYLFAIL